MSVFRVTTFFGQANMGWSETWWKNGANINEVIGEAANMLDKRNDLLTAQHSIIGCRVATEGSTSQSQLILPGRQALGGGQNFVTIPNNGDYPEASTPLAYDQVRANLHCLYLNAGRRLSLRYMVGIPDVSSKTESATLDIFQPPQWWVKWNEYHAFLQNRGWSIKCLVRGAGNPERKIRRWVTQGTPPSVVGVVIGNGSSISAEIGDKVQIKGVRMNSDGIRPPNKIWHVDSIVNGTSEGIQTIYLRSSEAIDPSSVRILGTIRPVQYEYLTFDQVRPLRVGVHKRGKPFNSPAGRARTKRYAA